MKTEFMVKSVEIKVDLQEDITKIWIPGTDEWKDLPVSIRCWKNSAGNHAGCDDMAEKIVEALFCKSLLPSGIPIRVGGHSMGGSLAVLVAKRLHSRYGRTVEGAYSFGGFPCTDYMDGVPLYSFRQGNDPVPMLFKWFFVNGGELLPNIGEKWPIKWYENHVDYDTSPFKNGTGYRRAANG